MENKLATVNIMVQVLGPKKNPIQSNQIIPYSIMPPFAPNYYFTQSSYITTISSNKNNEVQGFTSLSLLTLFTEQKETKQNYTSYSDYHSMGEV